MGFKLGIVGLPNVGKSTIFNALTAAAVPAENYPFCTVEPNVGTVAVPDPHFERLQELLKPERAVPTVLDFVDIAGLVRGAHKGEGLGNQFLSHIRSVDALAHVVRCFNDPNVSHPDGSLDPVRDAETIAFELIQKDLETAASAKEKAGKMLRVGDKTVQHTIELCDRMIQALEQLKPLRNLEFTPEDLKIMAELAPLTLKPLFYVANLGEESLNVSSIAYLEALTAHAFAEGALAAPFYGKLEAEIHELDKDEQTEYLKEMGLEVSGLSGIVSAGYKILDLVTFYTKVGPELRAWTVPRGTSAPKAAGKIHTDFERGFIKAEVVSFEEFVQAGSESAARTKGIIRQEGKEYLIQDRDVVHFRFNV